MIEKMTDEVILIIKPTNKIPETKIINYTTIIVSVIIMIIPVVISFIYYSEYDRCYIYNYVNHTQENYMTLVAITNEKINSSYDINFAEFNYYYPYIKTLQECYHTKDYKYFTFNRLSDYPVLLAFICMIIIFIIAAVLLLINICKDNERITYLSRSHRE